MKKNLVLTGMMGVGKSTIGKSLAKKLSFEFLDIDSLIEKDQSRSISSIFKNKSEEYFRKIEKEITLRQLKKTKTVISLGGGAFLNKFIRRNVKNSSVSFWIDVSPIILIKRLKKTKKRPLLLNKNLEVEVNKIYSQRMKIYNKADFRVNCNFLNKDEIINKIFKLYEDTRNKI